LRSYSYQKLKSGLILSGIAGILNLSGRPIDPADLHRMVAAMEYRGPDGTKIWREGPIGLAHCHYWTTPEEVGEEQPIASPDGRYRLTADARIDNRDDLIDALCNAYPVDRASSDAQLILAAYSRWGRECVRHLIGDFAFALWDARTRRLLLARDVIGLRQLFYAVVDGVWCFATRIGAIAPLLAGRLSLNRPLIEDFLRNHWRRHECQTVYREIRRLPPAHTLIPTGDATRPQLYYILGQERPDCRSREEWIEAFRCVLNEAVRCRLRSVGPVGILTSGGLDSPALACIAHELVEQRVTDQEARLYSAVYAHTPEADERDYFDRVANHCHRFTSTYVWADDLWSFREFGSDGGYPLDEPENYEMRSHTVGLFRAARAGGCRTVLAGEGSNQVLGHALYDYPTGLRDLRFRDALAEMKYYRRPGRMGYGRIVARAFLRPLLPEILLAKLQTLRTSPVRAPWVKPQNDLQAPPLECYLDERFNHPPGVSLGTQAAVVNMVRRPFDYARFSTIDVQAAYAGVEWRLPYLDRRVVDFLIHLPRWLQNWRGRDRILLREVMQNRMPEALRTGLKQGFVTALIHRGTRDKERRRIESMMKDSRAVSLDLIDAQLFEQAYASYCRGESEDFDLRLAVLMEAWLRSGGTGN
jgi:asparagine synthase (glutamine-hydrolysing)